MVESVQIFSMAESASKNVSSISPYAIISPHAIIDRSVNIGHWCDISSDVWVAANTELFQNVILFSGTAIGRKCSIHSFTVLGDKPQITDDDLTIHGKLNIGDGNIIREHVSIHKGSSRGGGLTWLGNNNLIMTGCHIGHDTKIGDSCIISALSTLAGHVELHDNVCVGGNSSVAQWVRLGSFAFIGGQSGIDRDVPPFSVAIGNRPEKLRGCNLRLLRRFFDKQTVFTIKCILDIWSDKKLSITSAKREIARKFRSHWAAHKFMDFVEDSNRSILR